MLACLYANNVDGFKKIITRDNANYIIAASKSEGWTPLHFAAECEHHNKACNDQFIEYLVCECNVNINAKTSRKNSSLGFAVAHHGISNFACVRLLLRLGADVHHTNVDGKSIMSRRLWYNYTVSTGDPIVRLLLEYGHKVPDEPQLL